MTRIPSEAPYTAADRPAGPDPTTSRSQLACGSLGAGSPTAAASSALPGLRSSRPCTITTGVSCGVTPNWAATASADGSASRSSQRYGSRFRAAKSRTRRVSGEYFEPTIRRPAPSPMRIERRSR